MHAIYTEVTAAHLIVLSGITYQFEGSKPWKISSLLQDFNDDDFDKVLESYKVVDVVHDECDKIFGVLMLYRR